MKKRIYYFRSIDRDDVLFNLQTPIQTILRTRNDVASTEIRFADDVVRVQKRKIHQGSLYLHVVAYKPGEPSSTLTPRATTVDDIEVPQAANPGREFKAGECFVLINAHNIIFCGNGVTHSKLSLYLHAIAQRSNSRIDFWLAPSTDLNQLAIIERDGVKSIKLDANAFRLSVPNQRRGLLQQAAGKIADQAIALIAQDRTRREERALEDLIVSIELGLDGNTRAVQDAKSTVRDLARQVLEQDGRDGFDGFVITTQSGKVVKPDQIKVHEVIEVNKANGSLNHVDAWDGMQAFYESLLNDNLLER